MIRLTCAALLALAAAPLHAQTWSASTFANGSLLFANVGPPEPSMGFSCTAPAPEGRPLIETGSHESHRTDAFEVVVGFFDPLFEWSMPYVIENIVITVDGTSYQMPPLELNELQGSGLYLPMTDPFFLSLFDAESLIFDTGQGTAYEYPVDGLAPALREAMGYCSARWVELGHALPQSIAAVGLLQGETGAVSPDPTPVQSPADGNIPASIHAAAREGCNGEDIALTRAQLQIADLDGDGVDDFLLNHSSVRCSQGLNYNCGAANCSIDAFLSSQGYQVRPAFLGMGADLVPMPDGRTGVQISGTYSMCGETGLCPGPQVWNGSEFALVAPEGPPPTTPTEPPQFILDRVGSACSAAGYSLDLATGIGQADFDQDGQLDYVLNGLGLTCTEGINTSCGASACSIDILLSSRDYERVDGYIGLEFEIQTASDGRPGLILYQSPTQPLSVWNGSAFVPAPETAAEAAPETGPTK